MEHWFVLPTLLALSACGDALTLHQICASDRSSYIQQYGSPDFEQDAQDQIELIYLNAGFGVTLTRSGSQCVAARDDYGSGSVGVP